MSKEQEKSTTRKGNPDRARSRNNPDGKRNGPKTDWPEYNRGRASEGKNCPEGLAAIAGKVRDILGMAPGIRDKRVPAILGSIAKSEDLSYGGPVRHFQKHPEDPKRCGLYRPRSASTYQRGISGIDPKVQQDIIAWLAGDDAAHGSMMSDSGGFRKDR